MKNRFISYALIAGFPCLTMIGAASGADITMLNVSDAGGAANVNLGDWGWAPQSRLAVFANEDWMTHGDYSIDVDLIAQDPGRSGGITIPTDFQKSVTNGTSFDWTGFTTTIIPSPGASISMVTALPNLNFGNVNIVDNGDGSYSINWDNSGNNGTGVAINDMATLEFGFDVTGPSDELVNYKLRQIPTPEPATMGLILMAGFGLWRRRRVS